MQIKHIRNSRILLEILILCIVYMSMAVGVYTGLAGNNPDTSYYCLIVLNSCIGNIFFKKICIKLSTVYIY